MRGYSLRERNLATNCTPKSEVLRRWWRRHCSTTGQPGTLRRRVSTELSSGNRTCGRDGRTPQLRLARAMDMARPQRPQPGWRVGKACSFQSHQWGALPRRKPDPDAHLCWDSTSSLFHRKPSIGCVLLTASIHNQSLLYLSSTQSRQRQKRRA